MTTISPSPTTHRLADHNTTMTTPHKTTTNPSAFLNTTPPPSSSSSSPLHPHNNHRPSSPPTTTTKKTGLLGTISNLLNVIIGAGIIGLPYAMKQTGLLPGIVLFILVAYITNKSLVMLVDAATCLNNKSSSFPPSQKILINYEDVMSLPFRLTGKRLVLFNNFIGCYGTMIAYMLIIKDTVPTVILGSSSSTTSSCFLLIVASVIILLPLSLQRDMASLSGISVVSVLADVILVGFVVFWSPGETAAASADTAAVGDLLLMRPTMGGMFIGLGILSFALQCQGNAFVLYESLADGSRERWSVVTRTSVGIATGLCLIMGLAGYIGFGDETQGDILNNFQSDSHMANAARILLAITMFLTYPMAAFVARECLLALYDDDDDNKVSTTTHERRLRNTTLGLYVAALGPALWSDDVGPVLSITGSIGGTFICYIAPGMLYLGVHGEVFLTMVMTRWLSVAAPQEEEEKEGGNGGGVQELIALRRDDETTMTATTTTAPSSTCNDVDGRSRPWWWLLLGFPLWCYIASIGSLNIKKSYEVLRKNSSDYDNNAMMMRPISNDEKDDNRRSGDDGCLTSSSTSWEDEGVMERHNIPSSSSSSSPSAWDFFVAIFLIVFGLLAGVIGLITNIMAYFG